jgi:hypothetical protein
MKDGRKGPFLSLSLSLSLSLFLLFSPLPTLLAIGGGRGTKLWVQKISPSCASVESRGKGRRYHHTITNTSSLTRHHTNVITATPSHHHIVTVKSSPPRHHRHVITATPSRGIHVITMTPSPPRHHHYSIQYIHVIVGSYQCGAPRRWGALPEFPTATTPPTTTTTTDERTTTTTAAYGNAMWRARKGTGGGASPRTRIE